jgi:hypothetical protein
MLCLRVLLEFSVENWLPYVFTSLEEAAEANCCRIWSVELRRGGETLRRANTRALQTKGSRAIC